MDGTAGRAVREFATAAPIRSSPSLAGGLLYIASSDKHVYALAIDKGQLVWKHALACADFGERRIARMAEPGHG